MLYPRPTANKLTKLPISTYRRRILIKEIFPRYAKLLKRYNYHKSLNQNNTVKKVNTISSNNTSLNKKTGIIRKRIHCLGDEYCNICTFKDVCKSSDKKCPCIVIGQDINQLQRTLDFERITIQDILLGRQPFAYIIRVNKYKKEGFIYRSDEYRVQDYESYLTFCSNPFLYLNDYKHIRHQINHNIFQDQKIIETLDYKLYFFIYKRLILTELSNYDILPRNMETIASNCNTCDISNCMSELCKTCKLNSHQKLYPYYNTNLDVDYYQPRYWNYKDYSSINFDRGVFIHLQPDTGDIDHRNATMIRIQEVIRYGLYLKHGRDYRYGIYNVKPFFVPNIKLNR